MLSFGLVAWLALVILTNLPYADTTIQLVRDLARIAARLAGVFSALFIILTWLLGKLEMEVLIRLRETDKRTPMHAKT